MFALAIAMSLTAVDSSVTATVCGCAQTAMVEVSRGEPWHRIFIDLDVPGAYGLSLVRHFVQRGLKDRSVIVTAANNPQWIAEAKGMGILGYIVKSAPNDVFRDSLAAVLNGDAAFPDAPQGQAVEPHTRMTRRQQDNICLLHRGYTSKAIAAQLKLSTGTVDNHVTALLRTLNVSSRTHAVAKAMELGYVRLQDLPQSRSMS